MKTETPLSPALERALELREERKSHRRIAEILEAEGRPLPLGRAKKWNHTAVGQLFQQFDAPSPAPSPPPAPPIAAVPAPAEVDPPPVASPAEPSPEPPPKPRRRLLKVKIQGPWIDTDSLLWDFLIHQVWSELTEKPDHTMPIQEALNGLRLTRRRRDREHLSEALDRLAASRVKLEGQLDNQLLFISTPLLSAALTAENLSFQFPMALIKLVRNPQQYIRLKELLAAKH